MASIDSRHIQNYSDAASLEPHWGYADRVVPCKNDVGSCQYLDVVYHSHDVGMLYVGIVWATIGGLLLVWLLVRLSYTPNRSNMPETIPERLVDLLSSMKRRWLLPEISTSIFGRTTRLQVLILALMMAYLSIWTFTGILYKTWITPVKNSTLHNTRTSLGPFADRVGVLAYALMPLSIMLSNRESILSLATGIPYVHFNFLHRWLGYVICIQSVVHTVGWTVLETALYQPQPTTGREWIKQKYMVWGIVAQILVVFMVFSSLSPVVRLTGHEFFRKAHYVTAMLFLGACWAHWSRLACFMAASLTVWFIDRGLRLVRTALLHHRYGVNGKPSFTSAQAQIARFADQHHGDVVRLDFEFPQEAWVVGQHFFLCFPELSIWQSHPFTAASVPCSRGLQRHAYLIRSKNGATKRLARLAISRGSTGGPFKVENSSPVVSITTPVILTGPYGKSILSDLGSQTNVLCVAGGTGVTFVLPVLLSLAAQTETHPDRRVGFVWAIRREDDIKWIQSELEFLTTAKSVNLDIGVFVTGPTSASNATPQTLAHIAPRLCTEAKPRLLTSSSLQSLASASSESVSIRYRLGRPNMTEITQSFVDSTVHGSTTVFASGPAGMISDLRGVVACCNDPVKVWRGRSRWDVRLVCDDRMEW